LLYSLFVCLYCLFPIAPVTRRRLQESPGAQFSRLWAAVSERARQVTLENFDPMCFLSLVYTLAHMLQYYYLILILRIWIHTWLALLSHAVKSVIPVFPSFVMLSLTCVFVRDGFPSIEIWFDRGEDWSCDLSKVGMVETVGIYQVTWLVMLESAKDWILGVDTPGQYVPPRARYGTACLLIRHAICCVSCSVEWGWYHTLWSILLHTLWPAWTTWCKRGCLCGKP
jgi:hypothetical protein